MRPAHSTGPGCRRRQGRTRALPLAAFATALATVGVSSATPEPAAEPAGEGTPAPPPEPPAGPAPIEVCVAGAKRPPLSPSSSIITQRDGATAPRRSAEDLLRLVPGMLVVQHGTEGKGHQFLLRGFDALHGSDLEVTVDGIPLNEWSNVHAQGYVDLGFVIPELVRSVEVIRGPFLVDQGLFAVAGSARFSLGVAPDEVGWRASSSVGLTGRERAVLSYAPPRAQGEDFVALEAVKDHGFGEHRSLERGAALARMTVMRSAEDGELSLLLAAHGARFDLPQLMREDDVRAGRVGFYDSYGALGEGRSSRLLGAVRYARNQGGQHTQIVGDAGLRSLALLENYTGWLLDPVHGDARRKRQQTMSLGLTAGHGVELARSWVLLGGLEGRAERLDQQEEHVDQLGRPLALRRELEGWQALGALRAALRWEPLAELRLEGGARLDVMRLAATDGAVAQATGAGTRWALSPRVSASWQATADLAIGAAYGRGLRPPEARAFARQPETVGSESLLGRSAVEPEITDSDSVDLGLRWRVGRWVRGTAAGFVTWIERESVYDHVTGTNLELNGTRRLGVELTLATEPVRDLTIAAACTVVGARFVESGDPVPFVPWLTTSLHAVFARELGLRAGLQLVATAPRALPHGAVGSTLVELDGTIGYRFAHWQLGLELTNMLGLELREGEYHFASSWLPEHGGNAVPTLHYAAGPPFDARVVSTVYF